MDQRLLRQPVSHCTRFGGEFSDFTDIFASVIQESAIARAWYVANAGDQRPVTDGNDILKYADDTYLNEVGIISVLQYEPHIPAENSTSCQAELSNIKQWATGNNLRLNPDKTFEIIFYARGRCTVAALKSRHLQPYAITALVYSVAFFIPSLRP